MLDCEGLELQKDNKESGEGDDCDDDEAAEDFPDEDEEEDLFAGRRNERLSKIIPTLEKKSNMDTSSQISARRGGMTKSKPETTEEEKQAKKEDEVRVVSTAKGGIEPCYVCGKVVALMPNNAKFCYEHKRVMDTMVKKWTPKRTKGKDKKKKGVIKKGLKKKGAQWFVPFRVSHLSTQVRASLLSTLLLSSYQRAFNNELH